MKHKSDWGIIGMGVMGTSLARNMARNGLTVSLFNRHLEGLEEKVAAAKVTRYPELAKTQPFDALQAFVESLATPRKLLLMLPAGDAVAQMLTDLSDFIQEEDIIIDGGNSHFEDTQRRMNSGAVYAKNYLGMGISGGASGALWGPSMMPSGNQQAYGVVAQDLEKIAAKTASGTSCCTYIGAGGAGHFTKMVHNGMEYAEMQLIAEMYVFLRASKLSNAAISTLFDTWSQTASNSYLLSISAAILKVKEGTHDLIDLILDKAGNKGTGAWATQIGAALGVSNSMMAAALYARFNAADKKLRIQLSQLFDTSPKTPEIELDHLLHAYDFCRLINHYQGFRMLESASAEYRWGLELSAIANVWRSGCILKSELMDRLFEKLKTHSILEHPEFQSELIHGFEALKKVLRTGISSNIPLPVCSAAQQFFLQMTQEKGSAHLIQAQRDYFGAHRYQRLDDESGSFYHTDWENQ